MLVLVNPLIVGSKTRSFLRDFYSIIRDDKVLGLFSPSHVNFEHDHISEIDPNEPSIMEMTKVAMDLLSKNHDGYYEGNPHRT